MKPQYVLFDKLFERKLKKFLSQLSETQRMKFKQRVEIFKEDIFDEHLKTHKLKGNLSDYYAFSISYSERIVFKLLEDGGIYLIEIGSHEICY
jgi:mRNA-degrading endonuclease YafQ of YafQ-DinJ toxin-antitoxin module